MPARLIHPACHITIPTRRSPDFERALGIVGVCGTPAARGHSYAARDLLGEINARTVIFDDSIVIEWPAGFKSSHPEIQIDGVNRTTRR